MRLGDYVVSRRVDLFEKISNDILKNLEFKSPTEIDVYKLCDLYGIKVNLSLIEDDSNYAVSHNKGRRGAINLCVCSTEKEERVSLTHEFSHIYIHHLNQLTLINSVTDKMEQQAFKLASNILIPSKYILDFEVYPDLNTTYIIADELAEEFNVPVDFAYKRLVYFNENYKFNKEESFKDVHKEENFDDFVLYEITNALKHRSIPYNRHIKSKKEDKESNKIVVLFNDTKLELK